MKVPSELNVWLKVRRKWLYSGLPSAAASGLAATCRMVIPLRQDEQPEEHQIVGHEVAAASITRQPIAISAKAMRIVGMDFIRASRRAAGKLITP